MAWWQALGERCYAKDYVTCGIDEFGYQQYAGGGYFYSAVARLGAPASNGNFQSVNSSEFCLYSRRGVHAGGHKHQYSSGGVVAKYIGCKRAKSVQPCCNWCAAGFFGCILFHADWPSFVAIGGARD